ncbi:bifunctional lysylphosphatidylglycerol flippase/synthetase MprF [Novosphingobium flavum]|uniref:Bifunctional lysylphosphatidylglycerol flippase/synthetase MprF n=1 Tax=Novosphingobium flavum TaxID=1778672 RepID=A0A7X1FU03_9SPHN|nr:bifunctional lysylphosphatidylglycerol flippase/synthetase MprF [Novosphingobium flavum]MBC2666819.1 bifunctional lysylphosphatidylglycerol flippase/synthetase MprF [Novosphingobium flavum]
MATALAPPPAVRHRGVQAAAALAVLALGLVAVIFAARMGLGFNLRELVLALRSIPPLRLAASLACTAASYLVLVAYDLVALGSLGQGVPLRRVARTAFTSQALGHTLGFSPLTGGSVRLRLYGAAGVPAAAVARIVAMTSAAFWSGVVLAAATCLLLARAPVGFGRLVMLPGSAHAAGELAFAALGAGALLFAMVPALRSRFGALLALRRPLLLVLLVPLGVIDLALSALALFLLLPPGGAFAGFFPVYALAILAGLASHAPGGVGVFEAVMLAGARPAAGWAGAALAAALLAYRAIYYLVPFVFALLLNLACEAAPLGQRLRPLRRAADIVLFEVSPALMGALTFAGGVVLLLSGAMPSIHGRMHALLSVVPLPFVDGSHLAASLIGTALLLVAPALLERLESGMRAARLLFMLGAAFSLTKGLDFEEAILMLGLVGLLQLAAPAFYRRTAGAFSVGGAGWLLAAAAAVTVSTACGLLAYRHLPYSNLLWWEFALRGDAPRFLRASFAAGIVVAAVALNRMLHRAEAFGGLPRLPEEVAVRAAPLSPRSDAALAFTGDKHFIVHPAGDAWLMFRQQGRTWLVMGDPVGPRERWSELCWILRRQSDAAYARLCFYQISTAMLPVAIELGLRIIKYGEEARIDPAGFSLDGARMKSLRNGHARALREGLQLRVIPAAEVGGWLPALAPVSEDWLSQRGQREKSFSLGHFTPSYLRHFDMAVVVRKEAPDRPLAFANLWRSGDGAELSVDLMRHVVDMPPGTMDFLFIELIARARAERCAHFNLGLAPLSGVTGGKLAPRWARLSNLAFAVDAGAYGFSGLRRFKEKYAPAWEPRFIAAPAGIAGLRALIDTIRAIGAKPGG